MLSEYPNGCMCSLGGSNVCRDGLVHLEHSMLRWILGASLLDGRLP